jgi:steroid 5-alpha reductase family enzyme
MFIPCDGDEILNSRSQILLEDSEKLMYKGVPKSFLTELITKSTTTVNTRWGAIQRVMAAELARLTHKIAIQPHLMAESCTICSSRSRRPVRKLLDTPSYKRVRFHWLNPFRQMLG